MACTPEPQTRLTVIAGVVTGSPRPHRGLPRWIHLGAGLHDVPHGDSFNLVGAKAGAFDGAGNRHGAQVGSGHILEAAAKGADCCPNRLGENH